jgi:predicted ferric reductase
VANNTEGGGMAGPEQRTFRQRTAVLPSDAVVRAPRRKMPARRRPFTVDLLAAAAGLGLGISLALAIESESISALHAPGGVLTAVGRVLGMMAGYTMMIVILLSARIPPLERTIGQDRLIAWHRRLGPWGLYLVLLHAATITIGYAQAARAGLLHEIKELLLTYPGVLATTVGTGLLVMAGITSYHRARARLRYETWWAVHLYMYLGLGLSYLHQVDDGAPFVGHPLARLWWTTMWIGTLAAVLAFRIGLPAWRSFYHDLRIVQVVHTGPHLWSVVLAGRRLEKLPAAGGQFLMWRFLSRGLWWQAHPYSLSAAPQANRLRITVKELGDHSKSLARLKRGTRVAFEGPYGVFTPDSRTMREVLLIGAGVGTTPIRALLDELPRASNPVVLLRGRRAADIAHLDEFEHIIANRGGRLVSLTGRREQVALDAAALRKHVPDIALRDVFVCGPAEFTETVVESAKQAGVPAEHIHHEDFAF